MRRKGFCWNTDGTKKVQHEDLAEAYEHAWQKRGYAVYAPFHCPDCHYYHVGRPTTNPFKLLGIKKRKPKQLYDEVLVGKLIGILRSKSL